MKLDATMLYTPVLINASHRKKNQCCGNAAGLQRIVYGCCLLHWNHYVVQALCAHHPTLVQSCLAS